MALTIPDFANASFAEQAAPDSVDFDAIVAGFNLTGVVTGSLLVSQRAAGANLSVDVATGSAYSVGTLSSLGSVSNVAITPDATNPRWVLITFAGGTATATHGTAAASPVFPAIPAGRTLLAAVWVPAAAASILNANITDKRVILGITPGTTVQTENGLDAGQVGTSNAFAHEDHRHPITNLVDLSTTQSVGGNKSFSGPHTLTGGNATGTVYGFLSTTASETLQNITAATATNKVQAPGTWSQFGQYWDGAATQFWSTQIASTVDSAAGATRMILTAGTVAASAALTTGGAVTAGGLVTANAGLTVPSGQPMTTGTRSVVTGTRTTTTNASDTVDLGTFSSTGGALELRIHAHLAAPSNGTTASVTKVYEFAATALMGTVSTWYKVLPADASANAAAGNDFALEVQRTAANTFQFRFRQKSIGTGGAITFTVETLGDTAVTFTPSTTVTAAPTAVSTVHPSNPLVTAAGRVGFNDDAPARLISALAATSVTDGIAVGGNGVSLSMLSVGVINDPFTGVAVGDAVVQATGGGTLHIGGSGPTTLRMTSTDAKIYDGTTALSIPRGLVACKYLNTASTTTTSTSGVTVTTPAGGVTDMFTGATSTTLSVTQTLVAGRRYLVEFVATPHSSVAGDVVGMLIQPTVTPTTLWQGTATANANVAITGAFNYHARCDAIAVSATTTAYTFNATYLRRNGTGLVDMAAGSMLRITDIGAV